MCDAGCGLGYLSLEITKRCAYVTAADASKEALDILRANIERNPCPNLSIWEGDVFSMPPEMKFDAMVFCFFASVRDALKCAKMHCGGKLILFKKNWQSHRFMLHDRPLERFTYVLTCQELNELGLPYESESFEQEMGQPFRSVSDAESFFRLHDRDGAQTEIARRDVEAMLIENDSADFPYYLPMKRSVGMIALNAGDIPDFK